MAFIMGVNVAYRQVNNLSITLWKESLNSDGQQFYQYKQHKQLPFISNNWTQKNPTPICLRQMQKCGWVKSTNTIPISLDNGNTGINKQYIYIFFYSSSQQKQWATGWHVAPVKRIILTRVTCRSSQTHYLDTGDMSLQSNALSWHGWHVALVKRIILTTRQPILLLYAAC